MPDDFRVLRESARLDPPWAVVERICLELTSPWDPDPRFDQLTPGQRAIHVLTLIDFEVSNGGFWQCFDNSTGSLLPLAVDSAQQLGSVEWASFYQRAVAYFPSPFPTDRERRQHLLETLYERDPQTVMDLDTEFDSLCGSTDTNPYRLFDRYIEQHPEEFFVDNDDEEIAAAALVELISRRLAKHNRIHERVLAGYRALLEEAVERSRVGGTGVAADAAATLLEQPPFVHRLPDHYRRRREQS